MLKKLVFDFLGVQFLRFVVVGIINTAFGYLAFSFFTVIGTDYVYATLFATICGALFNFKTIGGYVFKSKDNSLIWRFLSVYALIYLFNVVSLGYLKEYVENIYLAQAIVTPGIALLSFSLNKIFTYKTAEKTKK